MYRGRNREPVFGLLAGVFHLPPGCAGYAHYTYGETRTQVRPGALHSGGTMSPGASAAKRRVSNEQNAAWAVRRPRRSAYRPKVLLVGRQIWSMLRAEKSHGDRADGTDPAVGAPRLRTMPGHPDGAVRARVAGRRIVRWSNEPRVRREGSAAAAKPGEPASLRAKCGRTDIKLLTELPPCATILPTDN